MYRPQARKIRSADALPYFCQNPYKNPYQYPFQNQIRNVFLISFLTLFFLSGCFSTGGDSSESTAGEDIIQFFLRGDQEVPSVPGDGFGVSTLTVSRDSGSISGSVSVLFDLSGPVTSAHIHSGKAGENGSVVITLVQEPEKPTQWNIPEGSTLAANELSDFFAGKMYLNLHTDAQPNGEIRGQIVTSNIRVVQLALEGENEVPPDDTTARAVAYLTIDTKNNLDISGRINTTGFDSVSSARIYEGFAGLEQSGKGSVVSFEEDKSDPSLWLLASDTRLTTTELDRLLAGGMYISVRSESNGDIRGQIAPLGITIIRTELKGESEIPPVESVGSAVAYLTLNSSSSTILANIRTEGLPDSTGASIYRGYAGRTGAPVVSFNQDLSSNTSSQLWRSEEDFVLSNEDFRAGRLYFNLLTTSNSFGEVRGQILPEGVTVTRTLLSGDQEVPPVVTGASGIAYTTVIQRGGAVNTVIHTSDLESDATLAHIHEGAKGSEGGIALTLEQDEDNSAIWSTTSNSAFDAVQLNLFNTGGLYFNVHTSGNSEGEIRGQIQP